MVRAAFFDKNGMKKGAWSKEEDDKLRAYVLRYGHWNWRQLPKFAGLSRCGKSCRLRWMNYLRPTVKRGNYSKEEDDLILQLRDQLGNKWSAIAAKLQGRTDNEIKNHWHTYLKKGANTRIVQKMTSSNSEVTPKQPGQTSKPEVNEEDQAAGPSQLQQGGEQNSNNKDLTPENTNVFAYHSPSELTSESFPSSRDQQSSNDQFDYALLNVFNWAADDSINSSESFMEPIENFWTEPFLPDKDTVIGSELLLAPLFDSGNNLEEISCHAQMI